ncbi:hypothetical protein G6L37_06410 [Agrobacterium rubi]|nr:hypothetical protein [Agrobacterium rubi]NTF24995.1 hypothetical protein [Agrobacterium rubi]
MADVYVVDWNGYSGGIYRTLEVAVESLAHTALWKGDEGFQVYMEAFSKDIEPLVKLGVGGTRLDHHLYAIMTSEHMNHFVIAAQDIDVRPGFSPSIKTLLSDEMESPYWMIQKALYDFATNNFDDIDTLKDKLYTDIEHQVETTKAEARDPDHAVRKLTDRDLVFVSGLDREIEKGSGDDAESFLSNLPERALYVFEDLARQAFPDAFEDIADHAPA